MLTMDTMLNRQTCVPNTTSSALSMHRNSLAISKVKPKIRIIHIYAPEIIKTDVANFRELVQRLTGKPTESNTRKKSRITTKANARAVPKNASDAPKNVEVEKAYRFFELRERIKGEEEMWSGSGDQNSGGFLGGFADLDGFMQELNQFPLLPLDSSHVDAFGDTSTCLTT